MEFVLLRFLVREEEICVQVPAIRQNEYLCLILQRLEFLQQPGDELSIRYFIGGSAGVDAIFVHPNYFGKEVASESFVGCGLSADITGEMAETAQLKMKEDTRRVRCATSGKLRVFCSCGLPAGYPRRGC